MNKRASDISLKNISGIEESGLILAAKKGINEIFRKNKNSNTLCFDISELNKNSYADLISVIICTSNKRKTLSLAVSSIISQNFPKNKYEIIVVNNSKTPIEDILPAENLHITDEERLGLSYARNKGAACASGEYLLYMDDDAEAAPDMLYGIYNAFKKNEKYGVIGGQIILDLPSPIPEIYIEEKASVWSGFTVGYSGFKEAKEQYEFPYGACFGVRHSALDMISGFPTSYGRVGDNFEGGEETAVCFALKSCGFKIGIEPSAKVIHHIPPERFTKEHIQRTIEEGIITTYRLFRDGYTKSGWSLSYVNSRIRIASEEIKKLTEQKKRKHLFYKQCELKAFEKTAELIKADKDRDIFKGFYGYNKPKSFKKMKKYLNKKYNLSSADIYGNYEKNLISVVLPVYNCERYLEDAILSVLSQTYIKLELIIVDDGSDDVSGAISDSFLSKDDRVKVIHQKNMTLPYALNTGFSAANGEFLTWTSADNIMLPDCLEILCTELCRDRTCDMVYGNMRLIDGEGKILKGGGWYEFPPLSGNVILPDSTGDLNIKANNTIGAAFLYRAGAAKLLNKYSEYKFMLEDYDYFMRMNSLFSIKHTLVKKPLYEYRMHKDSLTANDTKLGITASRPALMRLDEIRRTYYTENMYYYCDGSNPELEKALSAVCIRVYSKEIFYRMCQSRIPHIFYINFSNKTPSINIPENIPKFLYTEKPIDGVFGYDTVMCRDSYAAKYVKGILSFSSVSKAASFTVLRAMNDILYKFEASRE